MEFVPMRSVDPFLGNEQIFHLPSRSYINGMAVSKKEVVSWEDK